MRIALSPLAVYAARVVTVALGAVAWDWAIGAKAALDAPTWFYGGVILLTLIIGFTDYRIRRETGERAILDPGVILRSREFWGVVAIFAAAIGFMAFLSRHSSTQNPRFLIGTAVWMLLVTTSSLDRRSRDPRGKVRPFPRRKAEPNP